jgi:HAD superfamily hydrolase (TIGR01509 family)
VTQTRACLVDVYETLICYDFEAHSAALAAAAGVALADWQRAQLEAVDHLDRGRLSMTETIAWILRNCGIEPAPELIGDLVRADRDLMAGGCRAYDDAVPFLRDARSRGLKIALVSNCGDETRPRLNRLGLAPLADELVLSCEVGAAKPDAEIYRRALDALGVRAADAVMIDDQAGYCAGAEAAGVRAVQVTRNGQPPDPRFTSVSTLADVPALL